MKYTLLLLIASFILTISKAQNIQETSILANNGASNDNFGNSVDIEGDVMIVGAYKKNAGGLPDAGEVYVYTRSAGTWSLAQNIVAPDAMISDQFGRSVSLYGDRLAIGSPNNAGATFNGGAVYIYQYDGSEWIFEDKLLAGDSEVSDNFGFSVSMGDERLLIGCPNNNGASPNIGAAYIYDFDGTNWTFTQKLVSSFPVAGGENLGYDVALEVDVAVLGSPLASDAGVNSGTGFVYRFNGTSWTFEQKLIASDGGNSHSFSFSVDIDGDKIICGAYGGNNNVTSAGSCYIFEYNGTTWDETFSFYGPNPVADDWLGYAVAIQGETFVVGAINDNGKAPNCGAAHVYRWDPVESEWINEFTLLPSDGGNGDDFGFNVALDGFDIVVGSPLRNISGTNSGKAYYYDLCTYAPKQQICMATADSSSVGHYILFEKPRATLIDSFYLYKLDPSENLEFIAGIDYINAPEFYYVPNEIDNDTLTYFISSKNFCGHESILSDTTTTMVLKAKYLENDNVMLTWSPYVGYDFIYYRIYRDDAGNGNFVQISAMLKTILEFEDLNPTGNLATRYRIDAWEAPDCILSKGYENALSNSTIAYETVSVDVFENDAITIYPNPANSQFNIDFNGYEFSYSVFDIAGNRVHENTGESNATVNVQGWSSGMYYIQIIVADKIVRQEKIIVKQ